MTVSLESLPYDIIFIIASLLGVEDVFRLARSCRRLEEKCLEEAVCREVVKVCSNNFAFVQCIVEGALF